MTYVHTCTIRISLYLLLFPLFYVFAADSDQPTPKSCQVYYSVVINNRVLNNEVGLITKLFFYKRNLCTPYLVVQVDSLVCVFRYTVLRKSTYLLKYVLYITQVPTPPSPRLKKTVLLFLFFFLFFTRKDRYNPSK